MCVCVCVCIFTHYRKYLHIGVGGWLLLRVTNLLV